MTWTTWVSGWPAPAGRYSIRLGDATYDQGPGLGGAPASGQVDRTPGRLIELVKTRSLDTALPAVWVLHFPQ